MTLSSMENVLNQLEKRHSPTTFNKSTSNNTRNNNPKKKKAKLPDKTNDNNCNSNIPNRVPFGNFQGTEIYRNKIAGAQPEELASNGHYSVEELVLPNCSSAVCTSFQTGATTWLKQVFGQVDHLLILEPPLDFSVKGPTVGNAKVSRMRQPTGYLDGKSRPIQAPIPNWFWVRAKPHTGGCLHGKVLLLRSPQGLRVAICGGNLYRGQWEQHRDVFFVQDFPVAATSDRIGFGDALRNFMMDVTKCASTNDQTRVTSGIERVFDRIDFSSAKAQLVVSFPRTREEIAEGKSCGGWKQLAIAAHDAMLASGMGDENDDDDTDDNDDEDENNPHQQAQSSIMYASSGSLGDVKPPFLLQMHQAMNGIDQPVATTSGWSDVYRRVRCMWPSIATACKIDLMGLKGACRHMPRRKLNEIKRKYRNEIFRDAVPNPPTKAIFNRHWQGFGVGNDASQTQTFHAATHGKFMWNDQGVLYVGSHNFSRAAWGLHNAQPRNVEVGVVLATPKWQHQNGMPPTTNIPNLTYQLWQDRLPCRLDAQPSPYYAAYAGIGDLIDQHPLGHLWKRVVQRFQDDNPQVTEEEAMEIGPSPANGLE